MLLVLLVCAGHALPTLHAAEASTPNLLANPGFEEGEGTGYAPGWYSPDGRPVTAVRTTALPAHEGSGSVAIAGASPSIEWPLRADTVPVPAGALVEFSLWVKAEEFSPGIRLVFTAPGAWIGQTETFRADTNITGWTHIVAQAITPPGTQAARFVVETSGPALAQVDDASLVYTLPEPEPLFAETFDGSLSQWTVTGGDVSIDCAVAVSGCSLRVDPACCGPTAARVARSLSLDLPDRTIARIQFRADSLWGDTDGLFEMVFDRGWLNLVLNEGPNNNDVTFVTQAGSHLLFSYDAGTWYEARFDIDRATSTASVTIRTLDGTLIATSTPLSIGPSTRVASLGFTYGEYAQEEFVERWDGLLIGIAPT